MRTAIIDRSMAGMGFMEITSKSDAYLYMNALTEAGADYIEVDLPALMRLPKPSGAENYIFRIENAEEYQVANVLPFAYALLPLKFSYLISKIEIPVVLEIKTGDADILALLKVVSDSIDLTGVALLRLIGDFRKQSGDFKAIINKIRMKYAVPIDICPLNTTLGALSSIIAAYEAGVDSVTVSFGNSDNYAPLEEFLIAMATVYKTFISKSYISGICKASVMSALISDIETTNLKMLMKRYRLSPRKIETIDEQPMKIMPDFSDSDESKHRSLVERKLDDLEVDEDLLEEISDKLRKCGIDLYASEKKDEFLN